MSAFEGLPIPDIHVVITPHGGLRVYANGKRTLTVDNVAPEEKAALQIAKSGDRGLGTKVRVINLKAK